MFRKAQYLFRMLKNGSKIAWRLDLLLRIGGHDQKYGSKTIALGVEGEKQQPWKVKSEHKSYNYLTDINEILTIQI